MRRLIAIIVSAALLALIYWQIGAGNLWQVLIEADLAWILLSLLILVPTILLTAWRLIDLMPQGVPLGFAEANRLILASTTLNMVLPSKLGDIAKAYFMVRGGYITGNDALSLVVFEKAWDVLGLLLWCVFGLGYLVVAGEIESALLWSATATITGLLAFGLLMVTSSRFARLCFRAFNAVAPSRFVERLGGLEAAWINLLQHFYARRRRAARIILVSLLLWFLHLVQTWVLILALAEGVSFLVNLALTPLAILAGLLPFTFAGIGTRDAAMVYLFSPYMDPASAAAMGLLFNLRYIAPALAGLPFIGRYATMARAYGKEAS